MIYDRRRRWRQRRRRRRPGPAFAVMSPPAHTIVGVKMEPRCGQCHCTRPQANDSREARELGANTHHHHRARVTHLHSHLHAHGQGPHVHCVCVFVLCVIQPEEPRAQTNVDHRTQKGRPFCVCVCVMYVCMCATAINHICQVAHPHGVSCRARF